MSGLKAVNVIPILNKDPNGMLEKAKDQYQDAVIIGWDLEGVLTTYSSGGLSRMEILWLIKKYELILLEESDA
jgi:hypothetical protein